MGSRHDVVVANIIEAIDEREADYRIIISP
jgi:hypothetical protein